MSKLLRCEPVAHRQQASGNKRPACRWVFSVMDLTAKAFAQAWSLGHLVLTFLNNARGVAPPGAAQIPVGCPVLLLPCSTGGVALVPLVINTSPTVIVSVGQQLQVHWRYLSMPRIMLLRGRV